MRLSDKLSHIISILLFEETSLIKSSLFKTLQYRTWHEGLKGNVEQLKYWILDGITGGCSRSSFVVRERSVGEGEVSPPEDALDVDVGVRDRVKRVIVDDLDARVGDDCGVGGDAVC